jgi:hypothetical protein
MNLATSNAETQSRFVIFFTGRLCGRVASRFFGEENSRMD